MACPTDEAWACALHMLRYLQQNRLRGIRFSEDGRTQYGYAIMWGGPLITKSGGVVATAARGDRPGFAHRLTDRGAGGQQTGYHYNKEAVKDKYVVVNYVHTSLNISDACTKALGANKIKSFEPILHGYQPLPME